MPTSVFAAQLERTTELKMPSSHPSLQPLERLLSVDARVGHYTGRSGLAIFANVMAPYRANLHRLVAAGIPELKLYSPITHGVGDFDWSVAAPPEINVADFSVDGEHPQDSPLRRPI